MAERSGRGMGRAGASRFPPAASGGGAGASSQIWDPRHYFAPAHQPTTGNVNYSALTSAGDFLWGLALRFPETGTIRGWTQQLGNPTSGTGRALHAIYAADPADPIQPTDLLHAFELSGGGFQTVFPEAFDLDVEAGSVLWFVSSSTAPPKVDAFNGGVFNLSTTQIDGASCFGTIYDDQNSTLPTTIVALKAALAYAFPPPNPFPTIGSSDLVKLGSSNIIPVPLIKFEASL